MDIQQIKRYRKRLQLELNERMLPFWEGKLDKTYGGMPTFLDGNGETFSTDKGVWFQGRVAWTYSYLCNKLGVNEEWLDIASNCKNFMDNYCFDSDGRMYFTVTRDGRPIRKRRYIFSESFYVAGCAEYALASKNKASLNDAKKVYEFISKIYKNPANDPYKVPPKYNQSVRPIKSLAYPMIMLNISGVMGRCDPDNSDYYKDKSMQFIDDIIKYHYHPHKQALMETVGINGEFIDEPIGRTINPGHAIEAAWFLMSEVKKVKDSNDLMLKATNILDWSLERGWDTEYGGINYFVDIDERPMEQYEHDMKLWWPGAEALIAVLMAYQHNKDEKYLKWFEKIFDYCFDRFSDADKGEWVGYLTRDGQWQHPVIKSNCYKGLFHVTRMLLMCDELLQELETGGLDESDGNSGTSR